MSDYPERSDPERTDQFEPSLPEQYRDVVTKLEASREQLRVQEGELGRLRAVADTVDELKVERESVRQELATVRADLEERIVTEVNRAVEAAKAHHAAERSALEAERADLQREVEDLRTQLQERGVTGHVAPTTLASGFAHVLEDLAQPQPRQGRAFAAALTDLQVEARGVLEAPREGEEEPRFVTVEAGGVDPAQLSTLRMTFKLVPQSPTRPPPQP